ncbi:tetratricopeptide repeat protein, partial [Candidatus Microgenomates bacterium]|nr:tetratricopeptide repeat protein [Candidatus Microgenomates bacterium]
EIAHGVDTFMMSDSSVRHMALLDWQNALTVAIVAISVMIAWRMRRHHPIVTFCIGWFYVAMIPVLNILPSHSLFAERYVFYASFGFALLSAWLITRLKPSYAAPLATGLILIYVVGTIYRNTEWQNPMTLWSEVRRSAPHSPVGWNGVGLELENQGNHEQAMKYFQKAISLNKTYPNA